MQALCVWSPVGWTGGVFCNNHGATKNADIPDSALHKKHNTVNHDVVRKSVAMAVIRVSKEGTETNLADGFARAQLAL
jgi:hypothetical protein